LSSKAHKNFAGKAGLKTGSRKSVKDAEGAISVLPA
jgi:hypothetical protein